MTQLIALGNQKGGVGKTTLTLNIAGGLIHRGFKIAIIDADPQQSIIKFNVVPGEENRSWAYRREQNGLPPFPAPIHLVSDAKGEVHNEIHKLLKQGKLGQPDFILVDLPPRLEAAQTTSTLQIADIVVVPHEMTPESIGPTYEFLALLRDYAAKKNPGLKFCTVPNMIDARTNNTKELFEQHEDLLKYAVAIISRRDAFVTASRLACTVHDLPKGTAIMAIREIDEVVNKILFALGQSAAKVREKEKVTA
jgi:chromosome partitioning protein